jgi:hypothetical protein
MVIPPLPVLAAPGRDAGRGSLEEQLALARVGRERRGALEFSARVAPAAEF